MGPVAPPDEHGADASTPEHAAARVPPGRWAVGVSGGADSVALLLLLRERPDLALHVVHLDHETRAGASADDARFVERLAGRLSLPSTVARRGDLEPTLPLPPANLSARYRAARLALFRRVAKAHDLGGVILAHHADDQAETVLHRLLRGSGAAGLAGMSPRATIGGLVILRPLLGVGRAALRAVLAARGQDWREDASNASDDYARNRLRRTLAQRPGLVDALLVLGGACRDVRDWLRAGAPNVPGAALPTRELLALPAPVRRQLASRWLTAAGVPADRVERPVVDRLVLMAEDAATPARQNFPRGLTVRRKAGTLIAEPLPRRAGDAASGPAAAE
jgi:tRNA(Ile)-lysidine synthase